MSLNRMSNHSSLQKEENIFKLVSLLKKGTHLQEIDNTLGKTYKTIYKYLKDIQKAQCTNPKYIKYITELKPVDEYQEKIMKQWKSLIKKDYSDKLELEQFRVNDEKFYDELSYFLLCYDFLSKA